MWDGMVWWWVKGAPVLMVWWRWVDGVPVLIVLYYLLQGRQVNQCCSRLPSLVVSITSATQVDDMFSFYV